MKQDIESRFQILITISLFFPVLFYNLGIAVKENPDVAMRVSLQLGIMVGLILIDYIIFQTRKHALAVRSLKRIGEWLLIGIGIYIVPIIGVAVNADPAIPGWLQIVTAYTWTVATLFILAFPNIIEIVILFVATSKAPAKTKAQHS